MTNTDAYTMKVFLKAADRRVAAIKRFHEAQAQGRPYIMGTFQTALDLADAHYEAARTELLCAIERAEQ